MIVPGGPPVPGRSKRRNRELLISGKFFPHDVCAAPGDGRTPACAAFFAISHQLSTIDYRLYKKQQRNGRHRHPFRVFWQAICLR